MCINAQNVKFFTMLAPVLFWVILSDIQIHYYENRFRYYDCVERLILS